MQIFFKFCQFFHSIYENTKEKCPEKKYPKNRSTEYKFTIEKKIGLYPFNNYNHQTECKERIHGTAQIHEWANKVRKVRAHETTAITIMNNRVNRVLRRAKPKTMPKNQINLDDVERSGRVCVRVRSYHQKNLFRMYAINTQRARAEHLCLLTFDYSLFSHSMLVFIW